MYILYIMCIYSNNNDSRVVERRGGGAKKVDVYTIKEYNTI